MPMTAREKAAVAALKNEVRLAKALRFTEPVARDLLPPPMAGVVMQGWDYNGFDVYPAWTNCVRHGSGVYTSNPGALTARGPCALYSTEECALRALRNELEQKAAEALAAIDARIEELQRR